VLPFSSHLLGSLRIWNWDMCLWKHQQTSKSLKAFRNRLSVWGITIV